MRLPPFALYRALRRVNPSPYLFFLDCGTFAVAGSSPEILVKTTGGTVTIRPVAGTRRRGATPHEDKALEQELLADPKERAEHLMLLDLGRNDVGRVAEIGSVEVTDQFFIERFSQVMHIVSNVQGKLRGDCDALDALAAGFPAGTVSGAPKVRAMQIIDELEKEKRGLYAGCVGYFSAGADMDTCIVLRTALIKDGVMYVQAGAGIVADFRSGRRAAGMHQQGEGAVSRRRGSQALRQCCGPRAVTHPAPRSGETGPRPLARWASASASPQSSAARPSPRSARIRFARNSCGGVSERSRRATVRLYLIRVMFWPPQMPIAQPSTRIVVGPSSSRRPA